MTPPAEDDDDGYQWIIDAHNRTHAQSPLEPWRINWADFWDTDHDTEDYLCDPILARGRGHALFAQAKTGKSLVALEMAAALATGQAFLNQPAGDPTPVLYVDYEMTPSDLMDRLESFGYHSRHDLQHLHYVQMPSIPPLDTPEGGTTLVAAANAWNAALVVVDTTARAVSGDENAMETFRDFYRHTFMPLKSVGITTLRVDHAGKSLERGQRGSSAKNDDVDIVWELKVSKESQGATQQLLELKATHRRMGWIDEHVKLVRDDDHCPMHRIADSDEPAGMFIEGTSERAAELDALNVPLDWGRRKVREMYGITFSNRLWRDVKRHRSTSKIQGFVATQSDGPPPRTTPFDPNTDHSNGPPRTTHKTPVQDPRTTPRTTTDHPSAARTDHPRSPVGDRGESSRSPDPVENPESRLL